MMNILKNIKLFFLIAALLMANMVGAQDSRPNILVVLCDDLGYNDVGFNGSTDIKTPELDKLARGGTIFTSAYVAHPFCGPSRSAIMTGRYPHFTGTAYNLFQNSSEEDKDNMGIPVEETYMSKVLQDAGYYTGAVGKWHLGAAPKYHPNHRGFDNFYGFLGGGHEYFPGKYQITYQEQLKAGNKNIRDYLKPLEHNGKDVKETEYLTDAFSREAIRNIKTAAEKKKPFFVYLAYNAPHVPLQAKAEDLKKFANIKDKDRRTYAAMVYAVDRGVGQIIKTLKETKQYGNTLIVFLSDNGGNTDHGANNYPLKGTKGDTWEGGYRVPMFFHWPNKIVGRSHFDFPVSALDLYPTFVQMAKANIPQGKRVDGRDIMSDVLAGTDFYSDQMIYALRYREGYSDVGGRKGDWKITRMGNEPWRLHNLKEDIGEKKNLSGKYPELLQTMVSEMENWTRDFVRPLWFYSEKDLEYWTDGRMPRYDETFEINKLVTHPYKN
ncbi:sulfatase-like hydrolase/transferase [Arenibacter sp. F20364]|uniref:sulfatase-like hydrolase/transferase n=1 Tax=Arenibacter sp. F20364 TaxID=2926415 RepID=UPI001FF67F99|nr:sulfatase-like hydrolase/transferase [Arenibacter sp. F20364]MCK0189952.1 sulfatase-like hydrolase/transferase [Arenibacter sp. F20364]